MVSHLFYVAVGIVIGAFIPAVGRKIKAFFVKQSSSVVKKVESKL